MGRLQQVIIKPLNYQLFVRGGGGGGAGGGRERFNTSND